MSKMKKVWAEMRTPYGSGAIFTDAKGVPVDRPECPGKDAPLEERLAHMRAVWAYNDRVTEMANASFDRAFRKAVNQ